MIIKKYWSFFRLLLYLLVGLMNTIFIKPEDIGSWKNYAGYLFLLLGLVEIVLIAKKALTKKENG